MICWGTLQAKLTKCNSQKPSGNRINGRYNQMSYKNQCVIIIKIFKFLVNFYIVLNLTAFAKNREHYMNPLLTNSELPNFNEIRPEHFEPAIDELIKSFNSTLVSVIKEKEPTWISTIQKLDEESARLDFAVGVITQLNSVNSVDPIRKAYEVVLPKLANFATDLSQNKDLTYMNFIKN